MLQLGAQEFSHPEVQRALEAALQGYGVSGPQAVQVGAGEGGSGPQAVQAGAGEGGQAVQAGAGGRDIGSAGGCSLGGEVGGAAE